MKKLALFALAFVLTSVGCGGNSKPPAPTVAANFAGTWKGQMNSLLGTSHNITAKFTQGAVNGVDPTSNSQAAPLAVTAMITSTSCNLLQTATSTSGEVHGSSFSTTLTTSDGGVLGLQGLVSADGTHLISGVFEIKSGTCPEQQGGLTLERK